MEKEELEKETEQWKDEQTKERDKEKHQHKYVLADTFAQYDTVCAEKCETVTLCISFHLESFRHKYFGK